MRLRIEHATRPRQGETVNGDAVVVREVTGARAFTLFGVIDALGHGPEAHRAAQVALRCLETVALDVGLESVMRALHKALAGTRGTAATLCLASGTDVETSGVGNVELRCAQGNIPIAQVPGVLGSRLRTVKTFRGKLSAGQRIVVFSDGVSSRYDPVAVAGLPTGEACAWLIAHHGSARDDATALICDVEL